jgi:RecB family exonuclease
MINIEESILIHKSIYEIVHHSELQPYFSEDATIFNEREIVDIDNQILIPDRLAFNQNNEVIIIDYKTGKPSRSHQQQLVRYERVLMAMDFKVHKKLLVYIGKEILVEAF